MRHQSVLHQPVHTVRFHHAGLIELVLLCCTSSWREKHLLNVSSMNKILNVKMYFCSDFEFLLFCVFNKLIKMIIKQSIFWVIIITNLCIASVLRAGPRSVTPRCCQSSAPPPGGRPDRPHSRGLSGSGWMTPALWTEKLYKLLLLLQNCNQ